MTDVVAVGEGQTEEVFISTVLAPYLGEKGVFLHPRLIATSQHGRGGALSGERVVRALRNTLLERRDTFVTTFFDLFRLPGSFPGQVQAQAHPDPLVRAETIEAQLTIAVLAAADCRPERFIAHVQPHEFEALLFSDPQRVAEADPGWGSYAVALVEVRAAAAEPGAHQRRRRHTPFGAAEGSPSALREDVTRPPPGEGYRARPHSKRVCPFRPLAEPSGDPQGAVICTPRWRPRLRFGTVAPRG